MAENKIPEILADLPEDWGYGQTVAPEGELVGLSEQHGYNYLMRKVNECARVLNQIVVEMGQLTPDDMVTAKGGGELLLPGGLGDGPYVIEFTEEETEEYALKADLSQYAPLLNPVFKENIVVGARAFQSGTQLSEHVTGTIVAGYNNFTNAGGSITVGNGNDNRSYFSLMVGDKNESYNANASCIGANTKSTGNFSLATGFGTIAAYLELAAGAYNVATEGSSLSGGNYFIIGNGTSDTIRSNAFRISKLGHVYGSEYHSSGADYSEIYEWLDGNPDGEDRAGRFVVLDGERIRLAGPEDPVLNILGVVSAAPSVVGDSYEDQWRGMYERDIFGRLVYEEVEVEDPANPDQTIPVHRPKLNPAYDPSRKYVPQSQRPEKSAVGLLGKLVMIDDGTCEVNGWCAAGLGGIATRSMTHSRFWVMSRLDDTHIRINIMLQ